MPIKSLSQWLAWQESLNPHQIDLGLERVRKVAFRLPLQIPHGRVFTVAGTNGKGTCSTVLAQILSASGYSTGLYTSPHLLRYNERVAIDGEPAGDQELVAAFEAIEAVRDGVPLTYFEYGTLAAWLVFSARGCTAWVLEVGLGGRLDAVNAFPADFSLITTVDLDHQQWLGDTVEQIAAEKAGIIHADRPAFFGDIPVPTAVRQRATAVGASLYCLGQHYRYERHAETWDWTGADMAVRQLPVPAGGGDEQLRNISLALAALERFAPALLTDRDRLVSIVGQLQLRGRFQIIRNTHEWILDVAHNRQAARALRERLLRRQSIAAEGCTVVIGMLADKQAAEFAAPLADVAKLWITCPTGGSRGSDPDALRQRIAGVVRSPIRVAESLPAALELARAQTAPGGSIVVCGSFLTVGPSLEWLGLY